MADRKSLVIQRLGEIKEKVPEIRRRGISFRDTAEFNKWKAEGTKWLKLGLPHTQDELRKFQYSLHFAVSRARMYGEAYSHEDQAEYEKDCDEAVSLLDSAIENLEMDLIPEPPEQPKSSKGRGGSRQSGVNIGQAGTVVMGDRNTVSIVDTITVGDFFEILEREIEQKVADPGQRTGLIQRLKEFSKNPTLNAVLGQVLGQVLRSNFPHT